MRVMFARKPVSDTDTKRKYSNKKAMFEGITFDSKAECNFYLHLRSMYPKSQIEIQPTFILQDKFVHDGKAVRAITYVADFRVGSKVYDVKGMVLEVFKIKAKLFKFRHPDLELVLVQWKNNNWERI